MSWTSLYVLSIVFVATLIRSTFGFGEALFAVPLLALRIPLQVATPLVTLLSITIAGSIVLQDFRQIHLRSSGGLLLPSLLGIPLGLLLLTSPLQLLVKILLALVIIGFAGFSLIGRLPPELKTDKLGWLLGCGFCAGVLGAAYGMNGPPLVIYGTMRRWSAQHFRATLQGYFLPASALGMLGYWLAGLWTAAVTHYYLTSLLVIIPGVWLGRMANHRLDPRRFLRIVHLGLVSVGVVLLTQALRAA